MSDDLVKRLRTGLCMLAQEEAADRIEALEAKLAKADPAAIWREAMEAALSSLNDTGMFWTGLREGQLFQCEIEKIRAIPNPYEVKE